ncbi:hypothetical protein HK096_002709 [Nowakowskiella sp. JEL0078]|nr:hypothetical protein HK096_002709 [Nowakowskiella sp. JEL0078]
MEGFDQIVALSQNNINMSLKHLFLNNPNIYQNLKIDVTDEGTMTAVMNPPTVELIVENEEHKVYFFLNFKSGTFEYWNGHGPNSTKDSLSMDGWVFAFKVNLLLSELDKIPDSVNSRIDKNLVDNPDSYSVSQLLLDFQTADLAEYDQEKSKLIGLTPGLEVKQKTYLLMYLTDYIESLKTGSHGILGYAITVKKPELANLTASSFPPTSLKFQIYPYLSGGDANAPKIPGSGYNMLLFLQMTGGRKIPADILNWSGNWIAPSPPSNLMMAGTMAICKQNFWDGLLLPVLEDINKLTVQGANAIFIDAMSLNPSDPDLQLHDFSWKSSNKGSLTFDYTKSKEKKYFGGSEKAENSIDNQILWTAGSPVIKISGNANIKISTEEDPTSSFGSVLFESKTANIDWNFTLTLSSVNDGSLTVNASEPQVTASSSHELAPTNLFGITFSSGFDKATIELQNNLESKIDIDNITKTIKNTLNGQNKFVFPGGGTFSMKNPLFNDESDLLVELTYNQE